MNLFRLLTILILLPVAAMSGMPHVACRCSNGEVHLSCPKLKAQQASATAAHGGSAIAAVGTSCCRGSQAGTCCKTTHRDSQGEGESCCAEGCRCTPVLLAVDAGPKLAKVCDSDLVQLDLAKFDEIVTFVIRVDATKADRAESTPEVPIDFIVLYERFLI